MIDAQRACLDGAVAMVTVTLAGVRGSAPQELGAKLVATSAGLRAGTIGGGRLEAHALRRSQEMLADEATPSCVLETVNLQRDLGMTCGGEVTLLYEVVGQRPWEIVVFGAGHVAQALLRLLATLECRVRVFDPRPEWIEQVIRSPNVHAAVEPDMPARVATLSERCFVVVMTQGHATDLPVLRAAYERGTFAYLGVMGSELKARRVRRELEESGVSSERVAELRSPIGMPFGANTPAEIAVSVAAELIATRDARRAK